MKSLRRPKLFAEQLEERNCPSFVFQLENSTLYVTGRPTGTGGVVFTQTGNNQWSVSDNGNTILSKVSVDNISLSVTEHNSDSITFNLGGFTDGGNIAINLGNGDFSNSELNGVSIYNGTLGGNLLVLNGSGEEFVHLGYIPTGNNTATPGNLSIGGNVTWIAKENPNLTTIVPGSPPTTLQDGNVFDTGTIFPDLTGTATPFQTTVNIGGSVTAVGVGAVDLAGGGANFGGQTTVGGNLTQTMTRAPISVQDGGDFIEGNVNGNVTIHGAAGSTGDVVTIGSTAFPTTPVIGGNLSITLGEGANQLELSSGATVSGNTNIQLGDGNNQIGLNATFAGSLNVQLGNGNNTDGTNALDFQSADPFFGSSASVGGNFTLTAGNGNNNLTTTMGGGFAGSVGGNTNFNFGNGTDSITVSSPNLAGKFNWTSGNGADTLAFVNTVTSANYNVNVNFGNNNDSFTFDGTTTSTLTGSVNGGGRITANSFDFVQGTIEQPFTLSNFP